MIPGHFRSTTKVTSSVYKTPTSSTSQMTKANYQAAGKHQSTMNQGTVSCKTVEDLKKLYPNSFDRLGSLKGAYNIKGGPYSQAGDTCQKEGTNQVKGGNRQGAGLSDRRGNHHGAS